MGVIAADRDLRVLRAATAVEVVDTTTGAVQWRRPAPVIGSAADVLPGALAGRTAVLPQRGSPRSTPHRRGAVVSGAAAPPARGRGRLPGQVQVLDSELVPHLGL